jgi:hypothetical protein
LDKRATPKVPPGLPKPQLFSLHSAEQMCGTDARAAAKASAVRSAQYCTDARAAAKASAVRSAQYCTDARAAARASAFRSAQYCTDALAAAKASAFRSAQYCADAQAAAKASASHSASPARILEGRSVPGRRDQPRKHLEQANKPVTCAAAGGSLTACEVPVVKAGHSE